MNKEQKIAALKTETERLLKRIKEYEEDQKTAYPNSRLWAGIKRATLDLNVVGAKFRKY